MRLAVHKKDELEQILFYCAARASFQRPRPEANQNLLPVQWSALHCMLNMQMRREKCIFCVTIPTQNPLISDARFDLVLGRQEVITVHPWKRFVVVSTESAMIILNCNNIWLMIISTGLNINCWIGNLGWYRPFPTWWGDTPLNLSVSDIRWK